LLFPCAIAGAIVSETIAKANFTVILGAAWCAVVPLNELLNV
jgi:hypothetical protein